MSYDKMYKGRHFGYDTFEETQHILTNYLQSGVRPALELLQVRVYGVGYAEGDYKQRQSIKKALDVGRESATNDWIAYANSSNFPAELLVILEKYPELVENELSSSAYARYKAFMVSPVLSAGREEELDDNYLGALAVLWKRKIDKYSRQKRNLVITKGGRGARYFLPSYWEWVIRENILFVRKVKTAIGGKERIEEAKTGFGLESQKLLGSASETIPALEGGAFWKCVKCGTHYRTFKICPNCGTPREEDF